MEAAIDEVEGYQFVDNTALPKVSFIQIPSSIIMRWFRDGHIGPKGDISYKKFYRIFQAENDITRISIDLIDGNRLNGTHGITCKAARLYCGHGSNGVRFRIRDCYIPPYNIGVAYDVHAD